MRFRKRYQLSQYVLCDTVAKTKDVRTSNEISMLPLSRMGVRLPSSGRAPFQPRFISYRTWISYKKFPYYFIGRNSDSLIWNRISICRVTFSLCGVKAGDRLSNYQHPQKLSRNHGLGNTELPRVPRTKL